ncbi:hypothetical protein VTN00DRAFT_3409 [Thermoascus crustaceus]|uniref:uncharacterized protein n=1 Tax=Thermoascus crustaceus TaxID=5088 RepID=UPI00374310E9
MDLTSALSFSGLKDALETPLPSAAGSAALLGVILHLSIFRTIFVELYLYYFMGLYLAAAMSISYAYLSLTEFSILESLTRVLVLGVSFNSGLVLSISVYRLFFHRLRHFPGPLWAKLSRFYDAALAAKNVQYHVEVAKMHENYGDFIRTGPREICIVRKSAIPLIYGPQSKCLKSSWYTQVSTDHTKCSIHMTRDFDDHRRRRKAWDRALAGYEPRIKAKADLFVSKINAKLGKSLDATAWSMFLSFDIMGEVGFGKDFNNLSTGIEHPAIKGVHDHMGVLGVLSHVPWLLNILGRIPGATASYSGFFTWCAEEIKSKQKTWDPEKYPRDIISWLLKAFIEKDVSASPSVASLHEDSRVVIVGGSETAATTLATVLFFLAKYPAVLQKLQHLLDEAMPGGAKDWSYDKVKSITFIDDIINETLRLKPALLTGGYRVTPTKGLQVDEVYIPGDVNVFVPIQLIQTDDRYYMDAHKFIPERWGERRDEMDTDSAPFLPFSLGPYSCPGKNLAMMTLRIALSRITQQFSITFAPGETGEGFDKGAMDTFTTTLPPLLVQFHNR